MFKIDLALRVTGYREIDITRPSAMLDSYNPKVNLNFNQVPFNLMTLVWLEIAHSPIRLQRDISVIKDSLMRNRRLGRLLSIQNCYDLGGAPFDPLKLPPFTGNTVSPKDWAHLMAHIAGIYMYVSSRSYLKAPIETIEDRIFYNPSNSQEIVIAFNIPTEYCEFATYLYHVQYFMQSLADNRPDKELLEWIEGHRYIFQRYIEDAQARYARPKRSAH